MAHIRGHGCRDLLIYGGSRRCPRNERRFAARRVFRRLLTDRTGRRVYLRQRRVKGRKSPKPEVALLKLLQCTTTAIRYMVGCRLGLRRGASTPAHRRGRERLDRLENKVVAESVSGRFGNGDHECMRANRSELIRSAFVVHMPCGYPG